MATSISERVFAIVVDRLQEITAVNGYETSAGERVFRARRSLALADMPCVVVWDGGETTNEGAGNHRGMLMRQTITVEAHVAANTDSPGEELGKLKADIKKALLRPGPLVDDDGSLGALVYESITASTREDGGATEYLVARFSASYKEGYGDPYASSYK